LVADATDAEAKPDFAQWRDAGEISVTIPQLPVDSLYKFCAVLGIVAVLVCEYLAYTVVEQFYDKAFQFRLETTELMMQARFMMAEAERLRSAIDLERKENAEKASKQKRPSSNHAERELSHKIAEMQTVSDKIALKTELHKIKDEERKRQVQQADLYWRWIRSVEACGATLSFYGFRWWYRRIQRYQDALLRNQANKELQDTPP
jgi:hypothetical protein